MNKAIIMAMMNQTSEIDSYINTVSQRLFTQGGYSVNTSNLLSFIQTYFDNGGVPILLYNTSLSNNLSVTQTSMYNLGSNATIASYVNGNNTTMRITDTPAGEVGLYASASSQRVNTNYLNNVSNITWVGWVKPVSVRNQVLIWNSANDATRLSLQLMNNANIGFWNNSAVNQTSGFSYATNTWLHLVLTKNGNDFKLYCNGIERLAITVTSTASNGNLIVGGDTARGDYINGRIDNVSVHETTLTAPQILNIFNAQKARFGL
jgi:hypothetical protein